MSGVKNPQRVALVTPRYPPAVGGVERHVELLANGLVRRGVEVEVVATDPTGCLPRTTIEAGVLIRRFPTLAGDSVFFLAPGLGAWLLRHVRRFTVVHAHSYHTPLALQAAIACTLRRVPLVVTSHYHGAGHSKLRALLHLPYRVPGRWMMRRARRVICVSEAERALIEAQLGSLPTVVLPNGVDPQEILAARAVPKPEGATVVLSVARLERYKQVELLVRMLEHLPPRYELVVIGEGPTRSHLVRLAADLGVAGRLRIMERLPRSEVLSWLRTADVFVSMSQREAFGITVLEAMTAGAALVLSDIPAHREVAEGKRAGLVSFVSPDASAVELASAVKGTVARSQARGVSLEALPTWSGIVDRTLSCYRAALGGELIGARG